MELSVVVPVFNEADNISPLVDEIRAALEGAGEFEIVYVDDGSDDGTPDCLARARARSGGRLRVLRHRQRAGQSAAIVSGVQAARGRWIATLDGDGQNDPADIPRLLAMARGAKRPMMIAGNRRKRNDDWLRRLSSRVANSVRSRLLDDHTPDTGCGLKLFPRDVFLDLPRFDHMHRFLPALCQRAGVEVVVADVGHRPRARGRSKYGLHDRLWVGIVDLLGVLWLRRRALRLSVEEEGS